MESRWSRLRRVWWKLAGLALLEVVLVAFRTHSYAFGSLLSGKTAGGAGTIIGSADRGLCRGRRGHRHTISCLVDLSPHACLAWLPKAQVPALSRSFCGPE